MLSCEFAKYLRTPILKNICERLLLKFQVLTHTFISSSCEDHFLHNDEGHIIHYFSPKLLFSQEKSQFYTTSINQKTACSSSSIKIVLLQSDFRLLHVII